MRAGDTEAVATAIREDIEQGIDGNSEFADLVVVPEHRTDARLAVAAALGQHFLAGRIGGLLERLDDVALLADDRDDPAAGRKGDAAAAGPNRRGQQTVVPHEVCLSAKPLRESFKLPELAGAVLDPAETRVPAHPVEDRVRNRHPGDLGNVDLVYVPEPSTFIILLVCGLGITTASWRRGKRSVPRRGLS